MAIYIRQVSSTSSESLDVSSLPALVDNGLSACLHGWIGFIEGVHENCRLHFSNIEQLPQRFVTHSINNSVTKLFGFLPEIIVYLLIIQRLFFQ